MSKSEVAVAIATEERAEAISRACVSLSARLHFSRTSAEERMVLSRALDTMRDALALSMGCGEVARA